MLLELTCEVAILPWSYGFRLERSANEPFRAIYESIGKQGQGRVIHANVEGYFENNPLSQLRETLKIRIKDGVVRRMIQKWLKAGVLKNGTLSRSDTGTPQGRVIPRLIANASLHYVLDRWLVELIQHRLRRRSSLVRDADYFVLTLADAGDGKRGLNVLDKRLSGCQN